MNCRHRYRHHRGQSGLEDLEVPVDPEYLDVGSRTDATASSATTWVTWTAWTTGETARWTFSEWEASAATSSSAAANWETASHVRH